MGNGILTQLTWNTIQMFAQCNSKVYFYSFKKKTRSTSVCLVLGIDQHKRMDA